MNKCLKYLAIGASALLLAGGLYFGYRYYKSSHKEALKVEQIAKESIIDDATIGILSFNIENLGKSKSSKPEIMDILSAIITNFGITAIQEVSDKEGRVIPKLVDIINRKSSEKYDYVLSPRVGEGNQAEAYAYVYNTVLVSYLNQSAVYPDSDNDYDRPPFTAHFQSGKFTFVLATVHTKPGKTKEILNLDKVVAFCLTNYPGDGDIVLLGDMNAGKSYFNQHNVTGSRSPEYLWAITDDMDTTLAKSTNAHDRIVFRKKNTLEDFAGKADVFRFDAIYSLDPEKAESVSDHYPVWALFYKNKDTD
jgi:endonuclease/exonuclease/phosphatase family metal-dependent hydrolase